MTTPLPTVRRGRTIGAASRSRLRSAARAVVCAALERVDGELLVTIEEARYGFPVPIGGSALAGDPLTADLVRGLIDRGLAFRGYDGGSHEWPEQEFSWSPDYGWRSRQLDGTGNPVLADHQYKRLTESGHQADLIVAELAKHFQDDPEGWL